MLTYTHKLFVFMLVYPTHIIFCWKRGDVTYQRFICMYNCGTTGFPYTDDVNKTCYDNAS